MVRAATVIIFVGWFCFRIWAVGLDDRLHIITCDVGQGDAILIRRRTTEILVDGGRDSSILSCLQRYMFPWDRTIELVVATHPDADHITGLVPVLDFYRISALMINGQGKKTADFDRFKEAMDFQSQLGGAVLFADQGQEYVFDEYIDISVLYPMQEEVGGVRSPATPTETLLSDASLVYGTAATNFNESSVVLKVSYKSLDILLTGDLESGGEQALLQQNLITDTDVLKVGHHGAKTSSSLKFIERAAPEISLISVGKNNSYGHPNPQVLSRLQDIGSTILRTDLESTIELVSDGHSIWRKSRIFS